MYATEHIFADRTVWQQQAATVIADAIRDVLAKRGQCSIGLSGGSTPAPVFTALSGETIDWEQVTIFLADERCVPPTDPQSNQRLVRTTLLDHLTRQPVALFPDTTLAPDACADAYDDCLRTLLGDRGADILLLGLGPDGHTASLFPPVPSIDPRRFVISTHTDRFAIRDRISITPRVLRFAHHSFFLLHGIDKLTVWRTMLRAPLHPERWPAQTALASGTAVLLSY